MTAAFIAAQVRSGERTALEVIEESLDAAMRLDPLLHFVDRGACKCRAQRDRKLEYVILFGKTTLTEVYTKPPTV